MAILLHSDCPSWNTQRHRVLTLMLPQTSLIISPIQHQDIVESTGFKDTYFLIWVLVALHANLDQYLGSHIFKSVSGAFQHQGRISDESPGEEGLSDLLSSRLTVYPLLYLSEKPEFWCPGSSLEDILGCKNFPWEPKPHSSGGKADV